MKRSLLMLLVVMGAAGIANAAGIVIPSVPYSSCKINYCSAKYLPRPSRYSTVVVRPSALQLAHYNTCLKEAVVAC